MALAAECALASAAPIRNRGAGFLPRDQEGRSCGNQFQPLGRVPLPIDNTLLDGFDTLCEDVEPRSGIPSYESIDCEAQGPQLAFGTYPDLARRMEIEQDGKEECGCNWQRPVMGIPPEPSLPHKLLHVGEESLREASRVLLVNLHSFPLLRA